ncbi:MAG TPA: Hsp20/alpha crystallin family protein [Tepidisphaeraceae bacterium]|jgi:HSP20 family protein|nr:Hsp20/alpha crystallin family protein [Tepidisphaeraceae bacterium]
MVQQAIEVPYGNIRRSSGRSGDPSGAGGYYNFCGSDTWSPPVNLYETETAYLVCVDLAGVEKEKIDVEVLAGELTLRGHRQVPWQTSKEGDGGPKLRVHVMEIDHGSFCRSVELPPDAAKEEINASYRDGLLWIEIPKK